MNTIIFLGAGASASEGAPIQGAVFQRYLESVRNREEISLQNSPWCPERALPTFFHDIFGKDVHPPKDLNSVTFPTFEEALGILELAIERGESFGRLSYQFGIHPTNYPTLHQIRAILIKVLTLVLSECLAQRKGTHEDLCQNLYKGGLLTNVTFVTTNYDTFIDAALNTISGAAPINYGCIFDASSYPSASPKSPVLLKIHGSLDWLFCQTCATVIHTSEADIPRRFGVQCQQCEDFIRPLIVPPTFFKQMNNAILSSVWRTFHNSLRDADHIVFCGYSFPDADMHVKYAFKHQEVVSRMRLKVTVINEHKGKSRLARDEEKSRFKRFFSSPVDYTSLSFEEFASDPAGIIAA